MKTFNVGSRKRDDTRMPIAEETHPNLTFLEDMSVWFETWSNDKAQNCLTKQTSLACRHTSKALVDVTRYLLKEGYPFVLLGQLQSYPIEKRFGHNRQLCGGIFYAAVRHTNT